MTFERWLPAATLLVGALVTVGIDPQQAVPLRASLAVALPGELDGYQGRDVTLPERERLAAGVHTYLYRNFEAPEAPDADWWSLYVGYYDRQRRGQVVHSPKNCLPGAGWQALAAKSIPISTPVGEIRVNRYLVTRGTRQAVVLYWYQGRGRVQASEYRVKWDLLRDAAMHRRSEEALVRIVVPVTTDVTAAEETGLRAARAVVPRLDGALPVWGARPADRS